jgi:hypothetical protein
VTHRRKNPKRISHGRCRELDARSRGGSTNLSGTKGGKKEVKEKLEESEKIEIAVGLR